MRIVCTLCLMLVLTSICRTPASAIPLPSEILVKVGDYVLEGAQFAMEGYHAYHVYKFVREVVSSSTKSKTSRPSSQDFNDAGICYVEGRCGVNKDFQIARSLFEQSAKMGSAFAVNNVAVVCILNQPSPAALGEALTYVLDGAKQPSKEALKSYGCSLRIFDAKEAAESKHDGVALYNLGVATLSVKDTWSAVEYLLRALDFNYAGARKAGATACNRFAVEVKPLVESTDWHGAVTRGRASNFLERCRHYRLLT